MEKTDRRVYKRITIAGAKAHYKLENGDGGTSRLENLTKNSACIHIRQRVLVGQPVEIELQIPDQPAVAVKANIVWILPRGSYEEGSIAGIKFRPYSDEERNNSLATEKKMDQIVNSFI